MHIQAYHGSCDCGKVRFEAAFDLDAGTFKCNCKICWKVRFWGVVVQPGTFKLLSGQEDLTLYGTSRIHHFCRHCGVKLFGRGADGVRIVVSVAALDDIDPQQLARAPIRYVDGLHDNFKAAPNFIGHL